MANKKRAPDNAEDLQVQPWGVPDWRSTEGYPKNWGNLERDLKRWEFLRRDKRFREECDQALTDKAKELVARKYNLKRYIDPRLGSDSLMGPLFIKRQIWGGHIIEPHNPPPASKRAIARKVYSYNAKSIEALHEEFMLARPDWYDRRVWIEFNLEGELEEQIQKARRNLKKAGTQAKKLMKALRAKKDEFDPDDYAPQKVGKGKDLNIGTAVTMLRIYDAYNCGRTSGEIRDGLAATKVWLSTNAIWKRLKRAINFWWQT